jgi:hypothetical protein
MAELNIDELNKEIDKLRKQLDLPKLSPFDSKDIQKARESLRGLRAELQEINSDLKFVADSFRDSVNELSKQNTELARTKSSLRGISDISRKLLDYKIGDLDLSKKQLNTLEYQAKVQFKSLQYSIASGRLGKTQQKEAENAFLLLKDFTKGLEEVKNLQTEINSKSGVRLFSGLEAVSKAIPGLSNFTSAFEDASKASKNVAKDNILNKKDLQISLDTNGKGLTKEKIKQLGLEKELGNLTGSAAAKRIKSLGLEAKSQSTLLAGAKSLGPSLAKSFGPALIITELVQAFIKLDNLAGDTAKSMGISYEEATQLNSEFNAIANSSGNIFVTTKGINESFNQINAALGTNADLNEELLVTQTQLTKQAFYSVEAATEISKLSLATGKPAKEIVTSFLGQAKALNLVNNTAINEKQLIEGISKTSKGTLATFAAQPKKLIEAAFAAKKVGLELNEIKGVQDSLLNIESSIAAEFEAEVLTGKQLNLERARYYALTNNIAGLSQELGRQGIDQAKFAGMNVLQQESVAQAMGLSRDQLGGMLLDQAALSKLTKGDTEENRKQLAVLKEKGFSAQAIAELGQEEFDRQLASASVQDRFNASMEKLREVFVTVVQALMPIIDIFASVFELLGPIMALLDPMIQATLVGVAAITDLIKGVMFLLGKTDVFKGGSATIKQIGKAEVSAQQNYGKNFGLTKEGRESRVQDGIAPPGTGPFSIMDKNGNTTITAANDGLAVSPNITTVSSTLRPAGVVQQAPPPPTIDNDALGKIIGYHVAQAVSKVTVQTNLDGVALARGIQTPMGIATRK